MSDKEVSVCAGGLGGFPGNTFLRESFSKPFIVSQLAEVWESKKKTQKLSTTREATALPKTPKCPRALRKFQRFQRSQKLSEIPEIPESLRDPEDPRKS